MSNAQQERAEAEKLPSEDVVGVLLEQHARIRDLFAAVRSGPEDRRRESFSQLRALLAVHETAEEMIVRPAAKKAAGEREAEARNEEEEEANKVLAELEKLEFGGDRFNTVIADFEQSVSDHADHEEREEFPALLGNLSQDERTTMGKRLLAVEKTAPTHPHPAAAGSTAMQWAAGPFASVLDRARDAVTSTSRS
ncbi:hemerythrin domain-containing protein [Streptomyces tubbatahanensis]|uniref:Hemerythrin domain-containing protein n=1 Tax=Streptomyces tubbatahanensis TaxID=2923272 RepID=A0ABY3Y0Y0_9ACTN|nr:hemerythrin domain-containing protein [Streptomyces tubbatahanensis]UNT00487.1 hemerythrin domain-containing protein [Streptomyces tubbatahanensis]